MFKLTLGGMIVMAIVTAFWLPNYAPYNVPLILLMMLGMGALLGAWFYHEFATVEIDESDLEFLRDFRDIIDHNAPYKVQILNNGKMKIEKMPNGLMQKEKK